jgi:hypothetical protein
MGKTSSSVVSRMQPHERRTAKEKSTTSSQGILRENVRLITAVLRRSTASRQTTPTTKRNAERAAVSAIKGISENRSVQAPSSSNSDTVATVEHQIMTELSKAVSEEDRVMVVTKLVLYLMQQNGC